MAGISASDAQAALTVAVTQGATFEADSSTSASDAATAAIATFSPSGCATQVQTGPQVTYAFADCSGPYGLVHVNGSLTVTYVAGVKNVGVTLSSSNLRVGSTSLALAGKAVYSSGAMTLVLTPSGSATTGSGDTIAWSGDIELGWTSTCVSVDGSFSFSVDEKDWTVTATNYQRCQASCPAAGGSLALTGPNGSVTLAYDGSSSASYTSTKGTGTIPLLCGS